MSELNMMGSRLFFESVFILVVSALAFFGFPLMFGEAPYFDLWTIVYFLAIVVILFLYILTKLGKDIDLTSKEFDQRMKDGLERHSQKYEKTYTNLNRFVWFFVLVIFGGIFLYGKLN